MPSELLIETGPYETRVAMMEEGRVVEVHIERTADPGIVGSIYKGRVSRVVPGIQAAFVDLGFDRDAFLFAGDLQRSSAEDLSADSQAERPRADLRPIADHVRQGQEIVVQVVKEPLPGKGARISSQISLPGRLLVLLPDAGGVGISRRIVDPEERQRLADILVDLVPDDVGVIVRTAASGRAADEIRRDLGWLRSRWQEIQQRATGIHAPGRVDAEADLVLRAARDLLNDSIAEIWVDGEQAHDALGDYLRHVDPQRVHRLRCHRGEESLFDRRGVDLAITKAMRSRVWLDSGGFIVINPTEALVAIDVNSGRHTEAAALEATALETNLEAAVEVARQIRLRDLAGIIVVDFIDMTEPRHRADLVSRFEQALAEDRTRAQVSEMSDFGLIAVTRKRMRGGLRQRLTEVCPCCAGDGRVKDAVTVGLEMMRELHRKSAGTARRILRVRMSPRTKQALEVQHRDLRDAIEQSVEGGLELEADDSLGLEEFHIDAS